LVHGIGLRDNWRVRYWGRIPKALTECGARVHYGMQDAWGSIEDNAATLRATLLAVVEQEGCEKVNIIAHSKGGLDARMLASWEDCAPHIASITTLATPHAGSRTLDAVMRLPAPLLKAIAWPINAFFRLLGDRSPDFFTVCSQLTGTAMSSFNEKHPVPEGLFCQSYAVAMNRLRDDPTMAFSYVIVRHFEGANDGLVAVSSMPFGTFGGLIEGIGSAGISHCDVIDLRRQLLKRPPSPVGAVIGEAPAANNEKPYDIVDWHKDLVANLKARGL
jgi:triacylglycerol lipase